MNVKRFEVPGLSQYAYVISSQGEAILIDPMRDYGRYTQYAVEHGLTIRYVTETHIHADFASGAAACAASIGAELVLSGHDEGERYTYTMPHRQLRNGDELIIGSLRVRALHTPGHTPEHLSFLLMDNNSDVLRPVALFSGDFLFVGSLGRPDLLGEGEKHRLAKDLYRSVHERIAELPDDIHVYPGHGAGSLCGSGMSEKAESTLGNERATQRLFQLDEKTFLSEILESVPPMPSYYPRMKELNAIGAVDMHHIPTPKSLSPKELDSRLQSHSVTLLDLRRPEAFGNAHIPGAINIGAEQNLSLWAGWLLEAEKPILLVGETEQTSESRIALMRVGLDRIEGNLAKGFSAWIESGLAIARTEQLSTQEVEYRISNTNLVLVDVRSDQEWESGHIVGARHVMLGDLPRYLMEFPLDSPVTVVCGAGFRSSIAASLLQQAGFANVSSLAGGMTAWNAQGLPVVKKSAAGCEKGVVHTAD